MRAILLLCLGLCVNGSTVRRSGGRRSFQCGSQAFFNTDNGTISSHSGIDHGHNYGKDLDCVWTIEAPKGKMVELTSLMFDIENGGIACNYDWLELFDGNSTNSTSLGRFCGSTFRPISSTQRFLTLNFVTDGSTQQRGFKLFYNFTDHVVKFCALNEFKCASGRCIPNRYRCDNDDDCGDDSDEANCGLTTTSSACSGGDFRCGSGTCIPQVWVCDGDDDCDTDELGCRPATPANQRVCGQTNFTSPTGRIESPDYPISYPNNAHCVYHIHVDPRKTSLGLSFNSSFNIESDLNCQYDYVEIQVAGRKYGPYCGNTPPSTINVSGNEATVIFNSDDSDEYAGFQLNYDAI
ncbi:membrane frizzled-related protein-like [Mya arenaria]|uniref:membrane frizzled-related protein-like n=1 Tax=Mya arenaria TaxID=6604 RepID=UPI0022E76805|nr:membrane frizzled-related protein-like [Mya arenaria]